MQITVIAIIGIAALILYFLIASFFFGIIPAAIQTACLFGVLYFYIERIRKRNR